ncbi:MAG TPA: hypothetical protein DGA22_00690 [Acidobacterium sp.]|nr:hypothetical protein [Acidobacterium sp.]
MHQFRGDARFSTWLYRIAYSCFLQSLRRWGSACERQAEEAVEPGPASPPAMELKIDIDRAVGQLSEGEQRVILHCVQLGLSHEEAAYVLAMPLGTVKTHAARGKAKLRAHLTNWRPGVHSRSRMLIARLAPSGQDAHAAIEPSLDLSIYSWRYATGGYRLPGSPLHQKKPANHSERSVIDGSTRAARHAGTQQAMAATIISSAVVPAHARGSKGEVPKSSEFITRAEAAVPHSPMATPNAVSCIPSRTIKPRISLWLAPSAALIPISRVRSVTLPESTP